MVVVIILIVVIIVVLIILILCFIFVGFLWEVNDCFYVLVIYLRIGNIKVMRFIFVCFERLFVNNLGIKSISI